MKNVETAITDIFALAIQHEKAKSLHDKQALKMKAGKVRRFLKDANQAAIDDRSGVKISN